MAQHKLSASFLKNCPPNEYSDGGNLYFLRQSTSSASWVFRYSSQGRNRKRMGLGPYPDVSLAEARQMAASCRRELREGRDPMIEREERKREASRLRPTLANIARLAFEAKQAKLKGGGKAGRWFSPLEIHVLPKLGHLTVDRITVSDIEDTFKPIWRNKPPTARKAMQRLDYVIKYASAKDNSIDITLCQRAKTVLGDQGHREVHLRALHWKDVPAVYSALSNVVTHLGFKFYILTVPRVSNVTQATWTEMGKDVWTIPGERMKSGREFQVPLSWQSQGILKQAKLRFQDKTDFVFPSPSAHRRGVISENTWNKWLKTNGFNCTAHGFRSSFRDWAAENKICDRDLAEMCCDHMIKGTAERAYFRSDLLDQRAEIMQQWAEHVTGLTMDDFADGFEEKMARNLEEMHKSGIANEVTLMDLVSDDMK